MHDAPEIIGYNLGIFVGLIVVFLAYFGDFDGPYQHLYAIPTTTQENE